VGYKRLVRLEDLGWDTALAGLARELDASLLPCRVVSQAGPALIVRSATGDAEARVPGRFRRDAAEGQGLPVVGDWVLVDATDPPSIRHLLPRYSALRRKVAGSITRPQLLAANIDVVFVVAAIDMFNLRRVERTLTAAWDSGAVPAVVLTKTDLAGAVDDARMAIDAVAPGVEVLSVSATEGTGLGRLLDLLGRGRTGVLVGPSGAGKSTLINRLLGTERVAIGAVRADGKGRHTTVRRELHQLPGGGLMVDTPGIRELQLWDAGGEALAQTFPDIEALAAGCRFSDCRHRGEPECAVLEAVAQGRLGQERVESMHKLADELAALQTRLDVRRRIEARRSVKTIPGSLRRMPKKG
jgi:ribosome biogenesis GTPase